MFKVEIKTWQLTRIRREKNALPYTSIQQEVRLCWISICTFESILLLTSKGGICFEIGTQRWLYLLMNFPGDFLMKIPFITVFY